MGRASLPPLEFSTTSTGRNKGLLPPTSVSYTYSAPFVARFYIRRNVASREGGTSPSIPLSRYRYRAISKVVRRNPQVCFTLSE